MKIIRAILITCFAVALTLAAAAGWVYGYYSNLGARVELVNYKSADGTPLAGRLVLPLGKGPFPAVVQGGGSGRDGTHEIAMRAHATALARRGVAVLIYDKRGVGGSGGAYYYGDFRNTVSDIESGVRYLQNRQDIIARKIGYIGHSEGGHLMPEIVLRTDVKFGASRVGPVLGFRHFSAYQIEISLQKAGLSDQDIEEVLDYQEDVYDYFVSSAADAAFYNSLVKDNLLNRYNALTEKHGAALIQNTLYPRVGVSAYRTENVQRIAYYLQYKGAAFLEEGSAKPMLYVYAELDENVDTQSSVEFIQGLRRRTNQNIDIVIYPGVAHSMHKKVFLPFGGYPPGYLGMITGWVKVQLDIVENDGQSSLQHQNQQHQKRAS